MRGRIRSDLASAAFVDIDPMRAKAPIGELPVVVVSMNIDSRARRTWLIAIVAHAMAHMAASVAYKISISYQAISAGYDAALLGLLAAAIAVPPFLAAFHVGRWTDRVGGLRVSFLGNLLVILSIALAFFAGASPLLFVSGAMHGLGAVLTLVGQHAYIGAAVEPERQEKVFGNLFTANAVGQMVGPLLATGSAGVFAAVAPGLVPLGGLIVALVLAVLALGALALQRRPELKHVASEEIPPVIQALRGVAATKGAMPIILLNALVVAILDMMTLFLPAWGTERQLAPSAVGALLALRAAASILVRFLMTQLIALIGRRWLLIGSALLIALSLGLLPWADLTLAGVLLVGLGLALGLSPPISLAWISLNVPSNVRGSAMGLRVTINRFAQAALPAGIGVLSTGTTTVFVISAGLAAAASFLVVLVPFGPRKT